MRVVAERRIFCTTSNSPLFTKLLKIPRDTGDSCEVRFGEMPARSRGRIQSFAELVEFITRRSEPEQRT